ncbi:MAG TPA: hypothetical protein VFQ54_12415, partial [Thermomicrobiales bacterium]|nr:hypothetical protein [Thermomicrobiales bacterium]
MHIWKRLGVSMTILLAFTIAFGATGLVASRIDSPDRVQAATALPAPDTSTSLVTSAGDLHKSLAARSGTLRVVDLSAERQYDKAHIPGAIHAWWQDGMDPYAAAYGEVLQVKVG